MLPLSDLILGWPFGWKPVGRLAPKLRQQVERLTQGAPGADAWVLRPHAPPPLARGLLVGLLAVAGLALLMVGRLFWGAGLALWRSGVRLGGAAPAALWWYGAEALFCVGALGWAVGLYGVLQRAYEHWALARHPERYFIAFTPAGILKRQGPWVGFLAWERIRGAEVQFEGGAPEPAGAALTVPTLRLRLRGWPLGCPLIRPPWALSAAEAQRLAQAIGARARAS